MPCASQGIAEGMSIKLGEMMDQPRHQRIAKLAKEEEERKQSNQIQQKSQKEVLLDRFLLANDIRVVLITFNYL
jgi:hypothetical protein